MRKIELYSQVKAMWPQELNISDASIMEDGGFLCWALNDVYDKIEEEIGLENPWLVVAPWAFHQALCEKARKDFMSNIFVIKSYEVSIEEFDKFLRLNLEHESWENEREEYYKHNLGGG